MSYPLLIIFALAPSIIWLLFFLRKDAHPESNPMVLKIFFYGMLASLPAVFIEFGFSDSLKTLSGFSPFLIFLLNIFIGVAFVEEFLKYLVVKSKVLKDPEFDEPLDIMLYMIIAALGFAAVENLLIFLSPDTFNLGLDKTFFLAAFRFIYATFLHALASATFGFFIALSICEAKKQNLLLGAGLFSAVILHGLYNFSIMKTEGMLRIVLLTIIIASLAIFVSWGFKRLKKLKSVCKIT